eukprot:941558-Amphidinium_carterae.2
MSSSVAFGGATSCHYYVLPERFELDGSCVCTMGCSSVGMTMSRKQSNGISVSQYLVALLVKSLEVLERSLKLQAQVKHSLAESSKGTT